jgi:galactosylxylosylprotein 3-beta-galactosyltransferase
MAIRETWLNLRPWELNERNYQNELIFMPNYESSGFLRHESIDEQREILANYQRWMTSASKSPKTPKVPNLKFKPLFAIGMHELDNDLKKEIINENKVYSDMLLINDLKDSYKNLTLKLLESLHAINSSIPNFKYLLKSDDDSYVKLDFLSLDLLHYDQKMKATNSAHEIYWGFFNGRANVKKSGQWQELNFNSCDKYLPYALGGGYVISRNLVEYVARHKNILNRYESEDISLGTWLSSFRNIHRRHDVRFDTTYIPRACKNYHLILHKRTEKDMREIHNGQLCFSEINYDERKKPVEYFYDWTQLPGKCCDNRI